MAFAPAPRFTPRSLARLALLGFAACSPAPKAEPQAAAPPRGPERAADVATPAATQSPSFEREARGTKLRLVFHADPLPNLVYQLDCMAGRHPCSRAAYEALWQNELGWDDEDRRALEAFREIRESWNGRIERRAPAPAAPLPLPRADRSVAARLSIAGLLARTPDEHVLYLGLVTSPEGAQRAQALVDHFRPRFDRYWEREGRAHCEASADKLAALFEREGLTGHVETLVGFYQADLPDGAPLHFHLMARPAHRSVDAARQIGGHAVIEMPTGEPPEARAPVVVHEMLHHLHAAATDERLAALSRSFVETNDPLAPASYAVLDEALATALGTAKAMGRLDPPGLSRKLEAPMGLYAEPTIDRVAKAALPFLDARLAEGKGLHDPGFAPGFLAAVRKAFPDGLPPLAHARPLVAVVAPGLWPAFHAFDGAAMASSLGGSTASDAMRAPETLDLFASRPHWGGAFFVTHAEVADLARFEGPLGAAAVAAITAEAQRTRAFVYSTQKSPGVYRFVFVADDLPSMNDLVRALAAQRAPFEGALEVVARRPDPH
ncbi:hypothetical protein [Polyangium mundeleinium]|uniref:DUF4932 domain-containing protein n=1 Tax=Polyangium mundeleinium TaxID=2995306 RepID=A0ABT5EHL0_9BACT|nr:hypothetical protein [Polyangium mundeleinium]MDC0741298.1 hypothetical protein [Polyangium mundeleinium]